MSSSPGRAVVSRAETWGGTGGSKGAGTGGGGGGGATGTTGLGMEATVTGAT